MYELLQKQEEERLERQRKVLELTSDTFAELFIDYPTLRVRDLSRAERIENGYISSTLSYGEILFEPFQKLLTILYRHGFSPESGGKFVDIGSGIGKAVFAAALCHQFNACVGIEILSSLHHLAERPISEKWRKLAQSKHKGKNNIDISFVRGDAQFLEHIWQEADVVFAHWTAFGSDLIGKYSKLAVKMKPRSYFISISHPLGPQALFHLLETVEVDMSWGKAIAYIQIRSDLPDPSSVLHPRVHLDHLISKWLKDEE